MRDPRHPISPATDEWRVAGYRREVRLALGFEEDFTEGAGPELAEKQVAALAVAVEIQFAVMEHGPSREDVGVAVAAGFHALAMAALRRACPRAADLLEAFDPEEPIDPGD